MSASYYSIDFDRHPMPRSVVARIRERLAGKSGDAAAWKDTQICMEMPADAVTGRQPPTITDRLCHAPDSQSLGAAGKSVLKPGPHLRCSREKE